MPAKRARSSSGASPGPPLKRPAAAPAAAAAAAPAAATGSGVAEAHHRLGRHHPIPRSDGDGWFWYGTLLFYEHGKTRPSSKIAAFDYDGCLANTSLFRKGPDAWSILFPGDTEAVLKEFANKGYKLAIMSNQSTIGKAKASFEKELAEKKARLAGLAKKVGLPIQIFVATAPSKADDPYRKPGTGMWEFLERHKNGGKKVDRAKSLFCGDAAGRPKDHSDSDLQFAKAVGVKFYTEQDMFKARAYQPL